MNFNIQQYIPANFNNNSRVWIYQSSRPFNAEEVFQIDSILQQFADNWKSHGADVKGFAKLLFNQFAVIIADETQAGVSGCSTDSSVRVIKQIEQQFNAPMFERQALGFIVNESIQLLSLSQIENAIENGTITPDTIYFNNLVQTKEELLNNWLIPIKDSWLAKRYNFSAIKI
ncbi:hypothetical protein [Ferruginibacter albus]|uniref:hypothetical protein n=1 Tax=Ferruginibacter albus TaxID=2875540 RepID=UPI001CC40BEF|nr:hypothetical protein [Ferruginibacter albus]UAY53403.1 hypothetical protein K9M53_06955 [Ferruginibacter albus]